MKAHIFNVSLFSNNSLGIPNSLLETMKSNAILTLSSNSPMTFDVDRSWAKIGTSLVKWNYFGLVILWSALRHFVIGLVCASVSDSMMLLSQDDHDVHQSFCIKIKFLTSFIYICSFVIECLACLYQPSHSVKDCVPQVSNLQLANHTAWSWMP